MFDLSNSVIMPREDFIELSTVAWNQPPTSPAERVASTVQIITICVGMAAAFGGATWVWVKEMSKLEDKKLANTKAEIEFRNETYKK